MLKAIAPSLNIVQIRKIVLNFKPANNGLEKPAPQNVIAILDKLCTDAPPLLPLELPDEQAPSIDLSFLQQPLKPLTY